MITLGSLGQEMLFATAHKDVMYREAAAAKREELKRAEEELMEARRQELLSEEDGYWRQRMDQQLVVEKLKAEVAEQEELKGNSEVSLLSNAAHQQKKFMCNKSCVPSCQHCLHVLPRHRRNNAKRTCMHVCQDWKSMFVINVCSRSGFTLCVARCGCHSARAASILLLHVKAC